MEQCSGFPQIGHGHASTPWYLSIHRCTCTRGLVYCGRNLSFIFLHFPTKKSVLICILPSSKWYFTVKYCFCSAFYLTILDKKYAFWVKSMHLVKGILAMNYTIFLGLWFVITCFYCVFHRVTLWQDDTMIRWQDERMTRWQEHRRTEWHYDRITWWQDVWMTGWLDE